MSVQTGYKGKVTILADTVAQMGVWNISGMANTMLDKSKLEDTFNTYEYGRGDGGTVTFNGNYDPDDAAGQAAIITAYTTKAKLATILLYYGSGDGDLWLCPEDVSCLVETLDGPSVDESDIGKIGFTLKVDGGFLIKAEYALQNDDFIFVNGSEKKITSVTGGFTNFTEGDNLTIIGTTGNDDRYTLKTITSTNQIILNEAVSSHAAETGVTIISS